MPDENKDKKDEFLFKDHKNMIFNPAYVEDEDNFEIMKDYLHFGTEEDWAKLDRVRQEAYSAKYGDLDAKLELGCERCESVEWEHILIDAKTEKEIVLCERCYTVQTWDVL